MFLDSIINKNLKLKRKIISRLVPFKIGDILLGGEYWEGGFNPKFFIVKKIIGENISVQELQKKSFSKWDNWSKIPTKRGIGKIFKTQIKIIQGKPMVSITRLGLAKWNGEPVDVGEDSNVGDYWI